MPRLSALNFMLLLGSQLAASLPQPKLDVNEASSTQYPCTRYDGAQGKDGPVNCAKAAEAWDTTVSHLEINSEPDSQEPESETSNAIGPENPDFRDEDLASISKIPNFRAENPDFGDEDLASISKIPNSRAEGSDFDSGFMALECSNEGNICQYTAVSGDECLALAKNLGKGEVGVEVINQLNRALRRADQENFCDEIAEGKTFEEGATIYLPRPKPFLVEKYKGDILFISRRFPFKAAH